jgi:hypothetical protein
MDPVGVLIENGIAYVDTGYLSILNISDPRSPSSIGGTLSGACGCSSSKIVHSGRYLYVTGTSVRIFDISNLASPVSLAPPSLLYGSSPYGIVASADTFYVATSTEGVWEIQNNYVTSVIDNGPEIPSRFILYDSFPNPFNPSTSIRFRLPVRSLVSLKVFNVLGEEISTLVNGVRPPGVHQVIWDAAKVSSGVYFYRLIANQTVITKKMVVVR